MKKLILMLMLCAPMTMMAQKFGKVNTQQIMQSLPDVPENSAGLPGWSAGVAEEEQRTHAAYRSKGTYSYRGCRQGW